jgi:hypothetical protein
VHSSPRYTYYLAICTTYLSSFPDRAHFLELSNSYDPAHECDLVAGSGDIPADHLLDLTDPLHPTGTHPPLHESPPQPFRHTVLQQEPLQELAPQFRVSVLPSAVGTAHRVAAQGFQDLLLLKEDEVGEFLSESC